MSLREIILLSLVFFLSPAISLAQQGCCSWHDGVCGCSSSGRVRCCDGTLSPTCTCTPDTTTIPKSSTTSTASESSTTSTVPETTTTTVIVPDIEGCNSYHLHMTWGYRPDNVSSIWVICPDKIEFNITVLASGPPSGLNDSFFFCRVNLMIVQNDRNLIDDTTINWNETWFSGCERIPMGQTISGRIDSFPDWFDVFSMFTIYSEDYYREGEENRINVHSPSTSSTSSTTSTTSSIPVTTTTSVQLTTTTTVQPVPETFSISGYVKGDLISNIQITLSGIAFITTETDIVHGYYEFSNLDSGQYIITPDQYGYSFEPPNYVIPNLNIDLDDMDFVSTRIKPVSPCATEIIYGEGSEEVEILRYIRDNVLSQTPEGQEFIRLYYKWSPVIIKTMEKNEGFKEQVKEMIDGVLGLVGG